MNVNEYDDCIVEFEGEDVRIIDEDVKDQEFLILFADDGRTFIASMEGYFEPTGDCWHVDLDNLEICCNKCYDAFTPESPDQRHCKGCQTKYNLDQ